MTLKLNTTREPYQEFHGRNVEQMPKLIADGRIPMNVFQLMQKRLGVRTADKEVKSAWTDNYFDTGDAVVDHPDGKVKIVLDSQHLRDMTPDTPRNSGALIITPEDYDALPGEEFKKGGLGKTGERLSKKDVKAHSVWKVLARDQALLNDYSDYIFAEAKEKFDCDTAMGIFPGSVNGKTPEIRAWSVDRLEIRSNVFGRINFDILSGRFVGIAPEALSTPSKGVVNIQAYTMEDLQSATEQLDELSKLIKPESVEKIKSLVGKL